MKKLNYKKFFQLTSNTIDEKTIKRLLDAERCYPNLLKNDAWLKRKPWSLENGRFLRSLRDFISIAEALSMPKGSKILDLGVGPGWTSILFAKLGYEVVGVDVSPKMIEIARQKARQENVNVKFEINDIHRFETSQRFNAVVCYDVLHHCYDVPAVLSQAYNHLGSGGQLILLEPNFGHQFTSHARYARKRFNTAENGLRYRPLRRALINAGFKRVRRYFHPYPDRVYFGTSGFIKRLLDRTFYPKQIFLVAEK